jgi:bifunctional UDP-N-acetylglucosamine pyrophosphorylase/glucosamine-1-phosphate N-acetyltransferase
LNTSILILAAGLGTRMRSKKAKVLHRAGGLALAEHVVSAALALAQPEHVVVVTGHQAGAVEAALQSYGVAFARQEPQNGTGHAVECCRDLVPHTGLLMVLYGDTPLLTAATLERLRDAHQASGAAATLITTNLEDPSGYGRVVADQNGVVTAIVEHKNCSPEQHAIRVINSGIYCFDADLLWKHLNEVQPNALSHEYYLTDMASILTAHGHSVRTLQVDDPSELLGINTRIELAGADRLLRQRKAGELMLSGVTIERPETVTIDVQVTIGMDTIVEPFTRLLGETHVGEDCRIGAGSILESTVLGSGVTVAPYTLSNEARVEQGAVIGPFARLRKDSQVGEGAHVGNFVELKNTKLGAGAKSNHLAYLGDSQIGEGSNIGAGTIFCNYDGVNKHQTRIGKGAFVGSNSTLVAPAEIGDGAYIGAGSVVTEPVPADALAVGRARQSNKPGWAAARRKSQP